MKQPVLDRGRQLRDLAAKRETLSSSHQRAMVDVLVEHITAELAGDVDRTMATLVADPIYHLWPRPEAQRVMQGWETVRSFYAGTLSTDGKSERWFDRIVVDDDTIAADGERVLLLPGTQVDADAVDPDATYLVRRRYVLIGPFDGLLMVGEDSYAAPGFTFGGSAERPRDSSSGWRNVAS
jgi:hypothetical protein